MGEVVLRLEHANLIYKSKQSISIKRFLTKGQFQDRLLTEYKALNDVTLNLEKGKVYGVIGRNGAGKSTLLKVLSGAMSPNSGNVIRNYKSINLLALGVGFTKEISGRDNILLNGMLLGFTKKDILEKIDDIIEYSELGGFIDKQMKTYSSGMVSRLGFSIAINLKPEVLLIDETLSVGDITFREKSFNSIKQLIFDEHTTVVIVSHSIDQIRELCDETFYLNKGRLISAGPTETIVQQYFNDVRA
jgi:ABC-type polysaccharide/polyol phosphate transport system ATPase subunit